MVFLSNFVHSYMVQLHSAICYLAKIEGTGTSTSTDRATNFTEPIKSRFNITITIGTKHTSPSNISKQTTLNPYIIIIIIVIILHLHYRLESYSIPAPNSLTSWNVSYLITYPHSHPISAFQKASRGFPRIHPTPSASCTCTCPPSIPGLYIYLYITN